MTWIDLVLYAIAIFWLGFMAGTVVSDRHWDPLWREAQDGWDRNVLWRIRDRIHKAEKEPVE